MCALGPGTGALSSTCPVLEWNGLSYWAFSYTDNRVSMNIVAYDAAGNIVAQWEKGGARYVYGIFVDPVARTVSFAGQSDARITVAWNDLIPPPVVELVPRTSAPASPAGTWAMCALGPGTGALSSTCPVLEWNGLSYWAFSYADNRVSMNIVAYDAAGNIVAQWEKGGARYVYGILVDPVARTVSFAGQSDARITMTWDELRR